MKQSVWSFAVLSALALMLIPLALAGAQGEDVLAGSQWGLVSLDAETPAIPGSGVTLEFSDDDRVSGSAGCNRFGGSYEFDENTIGFSQLFSTMMMCMEDGIMEQEAAYLAALEAASSFAIEGNRLTITYGDGQQLVFTRFSPLTGTSWQLVALDAETPVIEGSIVTLEFFEAGRVAGTAGCNRFGGSYEFDGNMIGFSRLFSTMMMCMEDGIMEQEAAYLAALESATSFDVMGDQLIIAYGDGAELTFTRLSPLAGTAWELRALDFETLVLPETTVTLQFGFDNRAFGSGGCNSFSSGYTTSEDSIDFGMFISTLMACQDDIMAQEMAYFAALEGATSFMLADDQLFITYGDGDQLTFARAEATN